MDHMIKFVKYTAIIISLTVLVFSFFSCEDFLNPEQEIYITEDELYSDWYEYRSVAMGMYGLQKELVEQILILGELRGDLLTVTENADADLLEVYNFSVSKENKYASPTGFFKLISATNNLIRILKEAHPEVLDPDSPVNNYDRLYGEALCMRAWAYFNAIRIYGKVPFIHESLTSIDEIESYLNSAGTYVDSVHIEFGKDGYDNDTTYHKPIELEKQYWDEKLIIDNFTNELETKVKAVGVNHYIDNNDNTWEVSIWNVNAMHTLLGLMYLTEGDLAKAVNYFERIVYFSSDNYRYQLDNTFANLNWRNIFVNISLQEHIYTFWYNKANQQQNEFQRIFDSREPHQYMLKPSKVAVLKWETIWNDFRLERNDSQPWKTYTIDLGTPGDFFRGYGVSYAYLRQGEIIPKETIEEMLYLKSRGDDNSAFTLVESADTVVWKYSFHKNVFDQDANFIMYRAAGVHLWLAECYVYYVFEKNGGSAQPFTSNAVNIVNSGANYSAAADRQQLGVRGRVGFGGVNDGIKVGNMNYIRDPFTNEVVDHINLTGNFTGLQELLEDEIIEEKARELAFEGERFYELMRVAKRRGEASYLADRVAEKYPTHRRDEIYNLLLDENNWYIHYFE
ncbi:MAG: RagB/SusD family nutrient uptake outer membrane protein [Bacteroidales bacterium]